jgi:hypothetical protein
VTSCEARDDESPAVACLRKPVEQHDGRPAARRADEVAGAAQRDALVRDVPDRAGSSCRPRTHAATRAVGVFPRCLRTASFGLLAIRVVSTEESEGHRVQPLDAIEKADV